MSLTAVPTDEKTTPESADSSSTAQLPGPAAVAPTAADDPAPKPDTNDNTTTTTPDDPADEPQNALTAKFTSAEWKALVEFRRTLPEVFAESYPEKADSTAPIELWGVPIDPVQPKDDRVSVVLMKFLRARYLNVREAQTMMVATLRWRTIFDVDAAVREEFPAEIFGQLGHVCGHDKEGRPVIYNVYGAGDAKVVFSDVQRFLRWRVALMERSLQELDFRTVDQTVQVHDYEGVGMKGRDANTKNAASEATSIFQNHYPEFLYRKFFINVPGFLNWLFWIFKPLLSANTFGKMIVVGSGQQAIKNALSSVIEASELPKRYGGDAEGF